MLARFTAMAVLCISMAAPATAQVVSDQTRLVVKAVTAVERLRRDPNMAPNLDSLLARARAVLVVPDLVKGGFIIGGE